MTRLAVDSLSGKTLPHLDALYRDGRHQKIRDILRETPAEPLRRLTLAAVARHTVAAPTELPIPTEAGRMLETLISLNLAGNAEKAKQVLTSLPTKPAPGHRENLEMEILHTSISRYAVMGC